MSFAAIGFVGAVGIGASVYGTTQEIKGIKAEAEADEAVLKFNAAESRRKAERVRFVGAEQEFQLRTDLRRMLARNRVATAAAGVMFAGSPAEAEVLNYRDAASSIATLEETTLLEATGLERLSLFQLQQAKSVEKAAKYAKRAAVAGGVGDILRIPSVGKLLGKIF